MTIRQRVFAALTASAFGQAVTVGAQIALTPLFFTTWGPEKYGAWLILSGIPAYLAIADAGFGSAAGNEMTMRAAANDLVGAQATYRGALFLARAAALLSLGLGLIIALYLSIFEPPMLSTIGGSEGGITLGLLSAYVGLTFIGSVVSNGFRCSGKYATGIALANVFRLLEAMATGVLLAAEAGPVAIALAILVAKAIGIIAQSRVLRATANWLFTPPVPADRSLLRRLIRPALGFLAFPAANAIVLQGPLMVLGGTVGASAVALFATTRTLARLPIQVTNMINGSIWPELSRAYGSNDFSLLRRLHHHSIAASLTLGGFLAATLYLAGPMLMDYWIGKAFAYEARVMFGLLAATIVSSAWNASSVVLAATNTHERLSVVLVAASTLCIAVSIPMSIQYGVLGLIACLILLEIALSVAVLRLSLAVCLESPQQLLSGVLQWPVAAVRIVGHLFHARFRR